MDQRTSSNRPQFDVYLFVGFFDRRVDLDSTRFELNSSLIQLNFEIAGHKIRELWQRTNCIVCVWSWERTHNSKNSKYASRVPTNSVSENKKIVNSGATLANTLKSRGEREKTIRSQQILDVSKESGDIRKIRLIFVLFYRSITATFCLLLFITIFSLLFLISKVSSS